MSFEVCQIGSLILWIEKFFKSTNKLPWLVYIRCFKIGALRPSGCYHQDIWFGFFIEIFDLNLDFPFSHFLKSFGSGRTVIFADYLCKKSHVFKLIQWMIKKRGWYDFSSQIKYNNLLIIVIPINSKYCESQYWKVVSLHKNWD